MENESWDDSEKDGEEKMGKVVELYPALEEKDYRQKNHDYDDPGMNLKNDELSLHEAESRARSPESLGSEVVRARNSAETLAHLRYLGKSFKRPPIIWSFKQNNAIGIMNATELISVLQIEMQGSPNATRDFQLSRKG